jgi:hypothetical protein
MGVLLDNKLITAGVRDVAAGSADGNGVIACGRATGAGKGLLSSICAATDHHQRSHHHHRRARMPR